MVAKAVTYFVTLEHLSLWAPLATERSPPLGPARWPRHADLPLTYHPVPDIA